jgi:hypothetical protein
MKAYGLSTNVVQSHLSDFRVTPAQPGAEGATGGRV